MADPKDPTDIAGLVLWDVDHTLIEAGPVGRAIYRVAFERLVGRAPVEGPRTDGRTDLAIMADLFALNGIEPVGREAVVDALAASASSLGDQLSAGGRALPGAAACLAALAAAPGVVQSVLTGNIEPNARLKLGTFGLGDALDFTVGAYGSDSTVRAELVPIARGKVRERYAVAPSVTVLVGDTLRDVEAGRDGGALVLAVATGAFTTAELLAAGADAALESLADPTQALAVLAALLRS
jgi:phosphoglycolate phosphatase-like HAD superfamily hydrolase